MLALVLMSHAAALAPCDTGEVAVFSCTTTTATELAACAGAPAPDPAYLQVRIAPVGEVELAFPPERGGFSMFRLSRAGTSTTLGFARATKTYELWRSDDGAGGLKVLEGGKTVSTATCKTPALQNWEYVEPFLNGAIPTTTTATPAARPDPLAGKTPKEVCNDDSLLLLKYGFDDLRFRDGFKKACCVKGALGDDDRCQVDWPGGDVPACSDVDLQRNKLFALYGRRFKDVKFQRAFEAEPWYRPRDDFDVSWMPAVAQQNATRLKGMVEAGGCVADVVAAPAASEAACKKAGIRWSLDLQNATKGHVDGMQQSEIAEVVQAHCVAGWSDAVATCLGKGKGNGCLAPLTDAQRKTVWSEIKAISEDVRPE
ncbi:MAG: YARHG domain-containing protein [Deltaproteobacteria bacterium]|nr:YARHG domain-containing protein [Deltaproteobacteria bacterium]